MFNVLKSFLGIVLSCLGIGFSMVFPSVVDLILSAIFVALDLVGVFLVWRYSKSDLCGTFCTFCPSLALTEVIRRNIFIAGVETKTILLSLECSFILVLLGLLVYSVILCLKKKKNFIGNWGWVFSSSFFIYEKNFNQYDWSFFSWLILVW